MGESGPPKIKDSGSPTPKERMSNSGKKFERAIKINLEASGCVVTLSSASRGAADLVIRYQGRVYDAQAKYGTRPTMSRPEKIELLASAKAGSTVPVACFRNRGQSEVRWFRVAEVTSAKGRQIELIPWKPPWE